VWGDASFINKKLAFVFVWACPCGSGYPLQVLAALRAFRYYPSRTCKRCINSVNINEKGILNH